MPIGKLKSSNNFHNTAWTIHSGDIIYLFSDGFQDQFGGPDNKKFTSRRFRDLLYKNHSLLLDDQKRILFDTFTAWKGALEQTDDILVIGIRF
jgi:sigma-B regulation protein RsbU (phosphoserine phosphatase)